MHDSYDFCSCSLVSFVVQIHKHLSLSVSPAKAGPSAVLTLQSQLLDRASMLVMKVRSTNLSGSEEMQRDAKTIPQDGLLESGLKGPQP